MQRYDIFHALKEIGYFLTFCGSVYGAETISNIVLTKCAFRFNKMRISFFRYLHIVPATFFAICNRVSVSGVGNTVFFADLQTGTCLRKNK